MRASAIPLTLINQQPKQKPKHPEQGYHLYLQSLAPSGRRSMRSLLGSCTKLLGHHKQPEKFSWDQLNFQQLQQLKSVMVEQGYATSTINLALAGFKGIARACFNLGHLDAESYMRLLQVKSAKGSQIRKGRALSIDEVRAVINCCQHESSMRSRRDLALFLTGVAGGLRKAELCALMAQDFDASTGVLTVYKGKGNKDRSIHLSEEAATALVAWINRLPDRSGTMFRKISKSQRVLGKKLSHQGLTTLLQNLRKKAGINAFTAHDMRRTMITRLLDLGYDLNTVRQLAGHADISTSSRYDRRPEETLHQASKSLSFRK